MRFSARILILIALLPVSSLSATAQDTASYKFANEPLLVWQKPLPASLTGLTIAVGASPMLFEPMRRQNVLIREEVQMWRRSSFDHKPLLFDNYIQWVPLTSVMALNLFGVNSRHDGWPLLRRTVGCIIISTAITQSLKLAVDEWRPDRGSSTSFPSGHTSFAFSGAEMLRLEYGQTSPWIPAAGLFVAAVTGFMRIYNDRHWTGDVLAGAAIGIVSADLSYWLNDIIDRRIAHK